uniref:Uncharacterized protein n=1 Tax=Hyaloperonospora arabidopsidis (strain Emoy2) TaxID=559515 RepID=M4BWN4_HYAAE
MEAKKRIGSAGGKKPGLSVVPFKRGSQSVSGSRAKSGFFACYLYQCETRPSRPMRAPQPIEIKRPGEEKDGK